MTLLLCCRNITSVSSLWVHHLGFSCYAEKHWILTLEEFWWQKLCRWCTWRLQMVMNWLLWLSQMCSCDSQIIGRTLMDFFVLPRMTQVSCHLFIWKKQCETTLTQVHLLCCYYSTRFTEDWLMVTFICTKGSISSAWKNIWRIFCVLYLYSF